MQIIELFTLVEAYPAFSLILSGFRAFRDHDSAAAGKDVDGIGKIDAFLLHDKAKDIAALSTAKAVVALALGIDSEGRRFFLVKGAAGLPVDTRTLKRKVTCNELDNVATRSYLIDEMIGNLPVHRDPSEKKSRREAP